MGKKILLADDSITIQKVIELTFSDEDFEVVTVGNGRLAIERVQDVRPDIVLCDIIMPEKDGYEVCDYIKKHPQLSQVPVLLLTGAFEPFDQEKAARVGSDGFLAKPFEPQTLIAKVKDLLSQAAARRGAAPAPGAAPKPVAPPPAYVPPPPPPVAPPAFNPVTQPAAPPPSPVFQPPAPPAYVPPPPPPAPAWSAPPAPPAPAPAPEPPSWAPQPAPAWTVAGRAPAVPTPPPAPPAPPAPASWGQPGTAEVNFISDEPYEVPPAEPAAPENLPSATFDDDLYVPEQAAGVEDLMEVAPEEAATLQTAPPLEELTPAEGGWTQSTMEVSLEERAQAGVVAAHEVERPFEEVFEEESRPQPPPVWAAPTPTAPFAPGPAPMAGSGPREFEPEFAAEDEAVPAPPTAPAFVPEFEDSTRTVMFNAGDLPAAPPPPPSPPVYAPPPRVEPPRFEEPAPRPAPMPVVRAPQPEPELEPIGEDVSFSDVAEVAPPAAAAPSVAAEVPVPVDMVSQIAHRVIAQISDKVVREVAWEVIPELAEALIRKEIERLKSELAKV